MLSEPSIEHRDEQHCAGIRVRVTMDEMGEIVPPLCDEVLAWLAERDIKPAGPTYFRYLVIDMEDELEMEAGVPVESPVEGDDRVAATLLPAGLYAIARHTGHPDELQAAAGELLQWAEDNSITWQKSAGADGEHWVARTEFYLTDPEDEPDMDKWETELAFLTAINDSTG